MNPTVSRIYRHYRRRITGVWALGNAKKKGLKHEFLNARRLEQIGTCEYRTLRCG